MGTIARIQKRPTWIKGFPYSGWQFVEARTPGGFETDFDFEIQGDEMNGYHFCYHSCDGKYENDTWHKTMEEAMRTAEERSAIMPSNWTYTGCQ
jgi:hypothetical protein